MGSPGRQTDREEAAMIRAALGITLRRRTDDATSGFVGAAIHRQPREFVGPHDCVTVLMNRWM